METNNRKQTSAFHSAQASHKPTIHEVIKAYKIMKFLDSRLSHLVITLPFKKNN